MITLRRGNRLPTVAVFQSFMNQRGEAGGGIGVDGIFGRETEAAVRDFQRSLSRRPTGRVDYELWRGTVGIDWQIIDSVDLTDPYIDDDRDLVLYGQTVLRQYGTSRGAGRVINDILQSGRTGRVALLRMHGHGGPGSMVVASGAIDAGSSFDADYGAGFDHAMATLQPIFAPFGSIEMDGCSVGLGRRGYSLLRRMADATQVPVTAAYHSQYGGIDSTYRFEGRTRTVCPGGQSLRDWAHSHCRSSVF